MGGMQGPRPVRIDGLGETCIYLSHLKTCCFIHRLVQMLIDTLLLHVDPCNTHHMWCRPQATVASREANRAALVKSFIGIVNLRSKALCRAAGSLPCKRTMGPAGVLRGFAQAGDFVQPTR